jgi:predicted MPP superfamily phosphohydrolase
LYSWAIEPRLVRIRKVKVQAQGLSAPMHFLFISDFHLAWFTSENGLRRRVAKVRRRHLRAPYEAILLGGDFFDLNSSKYAGKLETLLQELRRFKVPIFAILGNHDTEFVDINSRDVIKQLQKHKVMVLENGAHVFKGLGGKVAIIGMKEIETAEGYAHHRHIIISPRKYRGRARKIPWYEKFDTQYKGLPRVLLSHNPDAIYMPGMPRPEVLLSGHTHGGQVCVLTWIGLLRFWFNPHGSFQSWAGVRKIEDTTVIISKGFGCGRLPLRLGCVPDVIDLTLTPTS